MNVLVIDDFINIVQGIIEGVNWEKLGVTQVFKAYNIIQAKKIFERHVIEVMVCDIEMPLGSGIELLEWSKEHYPQTECIFLTSQEKFTYAKAAVKLGSFDYLLQPIKYEELEKVIGKALEKVRSTQAANTYYHYGIFWEEHQKTIVENFWFNVLNGGNHRDFFKIQKVAKSFNLKIQEDMSYMLILISVLRREVLLSEWDESGFKVALKELLREILDQEEKDVAIIQMDAGHFTLILPESIQMGCHQLIQRLHYFVHTMYVENQTSISIYVGEYRPITDLSQLMEQLLVLDRENVAHYSKLFFLDEKPDEKETDFEIVDLKKWETYLLQGQSEKVTQEVIGFLKQLLADEQLDAQKLFEFHRSFIQLVFHVIEAKMINFNSVFGDKTTRRLYLKSLNSVYDMIEFVENILAYPFDEMSGEASFETSVETIKTYIRENLEKDLSRNQLADRVFLNPEYLSRLFKKQTGLSLTEYIANERVRLTKELLTNTDLSISIIASKVGYFNFSHFSQVFKKVTGVTPNDFRQKSR